MTQEEKEQEDFNKTVEIAEEIKEELEEKEVCSLDENKKKILSQITHPNRKILAEQILSGVSLEDLEAEWGKITVAEMNNTIAKINGQKLKCNFCNRK